MRAYLSGAIASAVGLSDKEKRDLFNNTERTLVEVHGLEVVNPLKVEACSPIPDGACGQPVNPDDETSHSWQCYMRYDIIEMMKCDFVVALPRWYDSKGARVEVGLARSLGMPVWLQEHQSWQNPDTRNIEQMPTPPENPFTFAGPRGEGLRS